MADENSKVSLPSSPEERFDTPSIQQALPASINHFTGLTSQALQSHRRIGRVWPLAELSSVTALAHGSRDCSYCVAQHVKPCRGIASQAEIDLFGALLMKMQNKKQAAKRGSDLVADDILASQLSYQKKAKTSSGFAPMNTSLRVALSELTTPASAGRVQRQLDVVSAFSNSSLVASSSADLDSAIANMVYCKALPFSFGECPISNVCVILQGLHQWDNRHQRE
eukprot:CCRYP_019745-RA/>CCRYP_019745-RA protein AED:0.49 eAED:0.55 QI:0/0/0/1/0/0/4/0/223